MLFIVLDVDQTRAEGLQPDTTCFVAWEQEDRLPPQLWDIHTPFVIAWHADARSAVVPLKANRPPGLKGAVLYAGVHCAGVIEPTKANAVIRDNGLAGIVHIHSQAIPRGRVLNSMATRFSDFRKAIEHLEKAEAIPFNLLEPAMWPEDLVAVYLALVAADKAVDVLNLVPAEIWDHAGNDLRELGGTCGSLLIGGPSALENKEERLKCRRDIHAVFSKIAASQP